MFANISGFDVFYLLMPFIDFVKLTIDATEKPNNAQDVETQRFGWTRQYSDVTSLFCASLMPFGCEVQNVTLVSPRFQITGLWMV